MKRRTVALVMTCALGAACSRSGNPVERVALLPFQNLTGDTALDWIAAAGPKIVSDQIVGTAARAVPLTAGALRDAYGAGATQLVHGYFEHRRQSLHYEFVVEDAGSHKAIKTVSGDGDVLPALDRLARQIDSGAHAFSSTNPQAVAAWAQGQFENAVALDPNFGAAWLSWARAGAAAGDRQQTLDIIARGLRQPAFQSPSDRAQMELLSAGLRQDQPGRQRALAELARLMPHDATLLRELASQEMNARRFPEAVQLYQSLTGEDPGDVEAWNMLGYAQAFAGDLEAARKSFERYGQDPQHAANALDSEGEALFLHGKFADAEKVFLAAHAKNPALLGGGDLLKAAYAHWLQGDLAGADQQISQYLAFRARQKDPLVPWRQAVWEFSTGRAAAGATRLSSAAGASAGPLANVARTQLAVWRDASNLPSDPVALKAAYERTPPGLDGIMRVLYAAALLKAGQPDQARKLIVLWPLPGGESDPLIQSFLFPKYLELKQQLK